MCTTLRTDTTGIIHTRLQLKEGCDNPQRFPETRSNLLSRIPLPTITGANGLTYTLVVVLRIKDRRTQDMILRQDAYNPLEIHVGVEGDKRLVRVQDVLGRNG